MDRKKFLKSVTVGSAGILGASAIGGMGMESFGNPVPDNAPNIIVIMADDMGFSDLGSFGSLVDTPNLDRLGREGLTFSQFYNNARCCPTRASLLTGLYPHQTGMGLMTGDFGIEGYKGQLNDRCVTIAEALKSGGYQTGATGKWHVSHFKDENEREGWPLQRGFDDWYGIINGAGSYYNPAFLKHGNKAVEPDRGEYYFTDAITQYGLRFMDKYLKNEDPFFLYLPYTAPHWPLHALEEDIEKYKGVFSKGWDQLRERRYRKLIERGIIDKNWPLTPRDPRVDSWENASHKEWEARRMAVYAAQIDRMDQGIGRILDRLEKKEALDNTLIMFLADNGGSAERLSEGWSWLPAVPTETRDGRKVHVGNKHEHMPGPATTYQSYGVPWANVSNAPFRLYKHWIHEGGISTPFIACWPGRIKHPGTITHQRGHVMDIMATCLEASGVSYPQRFNGHSIRPLEGKSLLPIFEGRDRSGHDHIGWEHHGNRAYMEENLKLVYRRKTDWQLEPGTPGKWELFDLEKDRTEMNNIAGEYPDKIKELKNKYKDWADRTGVINYEKLQEMRDD